MSVGTLNQTYLKGSPGAFTLQNVQLYNSGGQAFPFENGSLTANITIPSSYTRLDEILVDSLMPRYEWLRRCRQEVAGLYVSSLDDNVYSATGSSLENETIHYQGSPLELGSVPNSVANVWSSNAENHAINQAYVRKVQLKLRPPAYVYGDSVVVNQGGTYETPLPGSGGRYERNPISVLGYLSGAFTMLYRAARPGNTTEQIRDEQIPSTVGYPPGIAFYCFTHNNSGTGDTPQGWSGSLAGINARKAAIKTSCRNLYAQGHAVVLLHLAPRNGATSGLKRDIEKTSEILHEVADEVGCLAVLDAANDPYLVGPGKEWRDSTIQGDGVHPAGFGLNVIGCVLYRQWLDARLPINMWLPAMGDNTKPHVHSLMDGRGIFPSHTGVVPPGTTARLTASTYNASVAPVNGNALGHWASWTTPAASTGWFLNLLPTTESGESQDLAEGHLLRFVARIKGDFAMNAGRSLNMNLSGGLDWYVNGAPMMTPWWEDFASWGGFIIDHWFIVTNNETAGQIRFDISGSSIGEVRFADVDVINYGRMNINDAFARDEFYALKDV